jgi:hypothetical protein
MDARWSRRPGLNWRPPPYHGGALPLSYDGIPGTKERACPPKPGGRRYDQKDLEKVHEERHHDFFKSYEVPVHCYAYDVQFKNARINCEVKPINQRNFYHNYFLGNDPKKWAGHVGVFEGVQYQQLYEGVDLHVYSVGTSLKYDLIVHPKTKPGQIIMQYKGIHPVLKENGNLLLQLGFNQLEESSPYTYQIIDGQKVTVSSRYVLKGDELSFEFPEGYNRNYDLVIDPR